MPDGWQLAGAWFGHARAGDVEVREAAAALPSRLVARIAGGIARAVQQDRIAADRRAARVEARVAVLPHVHAVGDEQRFQDVVRAAERRARASRRRRTPGSTVGVARVRCRRRAIPGDVEAAVVSGCRPGEDVVVQTGRRNRQRLRPVVPFVGRVGIPEHRVTKDIPCGVHGRLLPDRVEIPRSVDRHRREVGAGLVPGKARDRQIDAVQTTRVADVREWSAESDREAAGNQDLGQGRVVVDHVDMPNRGRKLDPFQARARALLPTLEVLQEGFPRPTSLLAR